MKLDSAKLAELAKELRELEKVATAEWAPLPCGDEQPGKALGISCALGTPLNAGERATVVRDVTGCTLLVDMTLACVLRNNATLIAYCLDWMATYMEDR